MIGVVGAKIIRQRPIQIIGAHVPSSVRVPGVQEHFLINPYGLLFSEVTASCFVKIDLAGRKVGPSPHAVNQAGFVIHSAIHAARPDAICVLHTHSEAATAVSALEEGLLPLTQFAMRYQGHMGVHAYEGVARITLAGGPALAAEIVQRMGAEEPEASLAQMRALLSWDIEARWPELRCPASVILSGPLHLPESALVLPGLNLWLMPGVGHFPMLEDPAGFAALLGRSLVRA